MRVSEGMVFHGLTLLSYCGGGAFGDVYYCQDISGRHLAVKIIWKQKLGEDWKRELQGVANYQHITKQTDDLLQIFHIEEDDECFFYTMEAADSACKDSYVPDTLSVRLKNGPLPSGETFGILNGIFQGVKTLHEAGFVHRDIKPENILFVHGKPKLGDIGLLSSLDVTMTQMAGTLEFLPPEIRSGDEDVSDRLSRRMNDLYALGKVMYCCVTGEQPQNWPTVPHSLPLTLPLKFFLRLSLRLCNRNLEYRLVSLDELSHEFASIERKLMFGETVGDKLEYHVQRMLGKLKVMAMRMVRRLCAHWFISLLTVAVMVAIVVMEVGYEPQVEVPARPAETVIASTPRIVKAKYQKYVNERLGFSLDVPLDWTLMTSDLLQKLLLEANEELKEEIKNDPLLAMSKGLLMMGAEMMFYNGENADGDTILIQPLTVPDMSGELKTMSLEEIKRMVLDAFRGSGTDTRIYDVRRIMFKGMEGVRIELSHEPGKSRILNYMLFRDSKVFVIGVMAKLENYGERERDFLKILDTMEFSPATKEQKAVDKQMR